jgi:hypothetical protein
LALTWGFGGLAFYPRRQVRDQVEDEACLLVSSEGHVERNSLAVENNLLLRCETFINYKDHTINRTRPPSLFRTSRLPGSRERRYSSSGTTITTCSRRCLYSIFNGRLGGSDMSFQCSLCTEHVLQPQPSKQAGKQRTNSMCEVDELATATWGQEPERMKALLTKHSTSPKECSLCRALGSKPTGRLCSW